MRYKKIFINYTGLIIKGKKEGYGELHYMTYFAGDYRHMIYRGSFKDDLFDGIGMLLCIYTEKDTEIIYIGNWKQDLFNGKGVKFHDDDRYEGDFLQGEPCGKCKVYRENKIFYDGYIRGFYMYSLWGEYHDYIVVDGKYEDRMYIGQYIDGKRTGFGEWFINNELKYSGNWNSGMMHGIGKYYINGVGYQYIFYYGIPISFVYANIEIYKSRVGLYGIDSLEKAILVPDELSKLPGYDVIEIVDDIIIEFQRKKHNLIPPKCEQRLLSMFYENDVNY